jgi:hypothetical protein
LNLIIGYLESEDENLWYGVGLIASMAACQIIRATTFCAIIVFGAQTGIFITNIPICSPLRGNFETSITLSLLLIF